MLRLLATGAVDDTAAMRLGTSERTIRRRLARLSDQFGVQGRFALGVAVGKSGLLAPQTPAPGGGCAETGDRIGRYAGSA